MGTKVKCIDANGVALTKGQEYRAFHVDNEEVELINDDGIRTFYMRSRFDLVTPEEPSAFTTQVGGSHYKDMKIQPLEYFMANGIPFAEGNVIKYLSRWRKKNGLQDLEKGLDMLTKIVEAVRNGTYA